MSDTYWRAALVAALEDAGAEGALSAVQLDQAASVLAGAAETRGEVTGEVEAGRGSDDLARTERKHRLDAAISAAHARASRRRDQVGYPDQDPHYLALIDQARTLEDARTMAGLDRP